MKIKIQEKKKQNLNEFVGMLAALAVGTIFGYFAKKFFEPAKKQFVNAGRDIDLGIKEVEAALRADPAPEAKTISSQIVQAKQKLFNDLEEIQKQSQQVKTAAEMPEKPSIMIQKIIKNYEDEMEMFVAGKKINPATEQVLKKARFKIKRALKTIKDIDKIVLMASKKEPSGLWKSAAERSKLSSYLSDESKWLEFIDILKNLISDTNQQLDERRIFKLVNDRFILAEAVIGDPRTDFADVGSRKQNLGGFKELSQEQKSLLKFFQDFQKTIPVKTSADATAPLNYFVDFMEEVIKWANKNNIKLNLNIDDIIDIISVGGEKEDSEYAETTADTSTPTVDSGLEN